MIRVSLVLTLEAGAWRVIHVHYSTPFPDEELVGVSLTRGLSGLLADFGVEHNDDFVETFVGTATIVFTDIVDSTVLSQSMSDQEWAKTISEHFTNARTIVERQGGTVVKTLGDGGMFACTSASSAINAAIDIQRFLKTNPALRVRVGVHTGDVIRDETDYIGLAVSKAARVAAAAGAGEILVSSSTADMVNPAKYRFGEPKRVKLQGLSGEHLLRPVLWDSSSTTA